MSARTAGEDTLLTPLEAAARLRVSRALVYKLYRTGQLAGVKVGASVRIFTSSVQGILGKSRRRVRP